MAHHFFSFRSETSENQQPSTFDSCFVLQSVSVTNGFGGWTIGPWKNVPRFTPAIHQEMLSRFNMAKSNPGYSRFRQSAKVIGTWDGHDFGLNDAEKELSLIQKITNQRLRFLISWMNLNIVHVRSILQVILLHTRSHRDPLKSDGSILGSVQWMWLEKELHDPPSAITIIGSSIQNYVAACSIWYWVIFCLQGTATKSIKEDKKRILPGNGTIA